MWGGGGPGKGITAAVAGDIGDFGLLHSDSENQLRSSGSALACSEPSLDPGNILH